MLAAISTPQTLDAWVNAAREAELKFLMSKQVPWEDLPGEALRPHRIPANPPIQLPSMRELARDPRRPQMERAYDPQRPRNDRSRGYFDFEPRTRTDRTYYDSRRQPDRVNRPSASRDDTRPARRFDTRSRRVDVVTTETGRKLDPDMVNSKRDVPDK